MAFHWSIISWFNNKNTKRQIELHQNKKFLGTKGYYRESETAAYRMGKMFVNYMW
jgi:hypothetical protein